MFVSITRCIIRSAVSRFLLSSNIVNLNHCYCSRNETKSTWVCLLLYFRLLYYYAMYHFWRKIDFYKKCSSVFHWFFTFCKLVASEPIQPKYYFVFKGMEPKAFDTDRCVNHLAMETVSDLYYTDLIISLHLKNITTVDFYP